MHCDRGSTSCRSAVVRFMTTGEGGRLTPPSSGVRSQIDLGSYQTSCVVESETGLDVIPLGQDVRVNICVLFPEQVSADFAALLEFELFEGNKRVAVGAFSDDTKTREPGGQWD